MSVKQVIKENLGWALVMGVLAVIVTGGKPEMFWGGVGGWLIAKWLESD